MRSLSLYMSLLLTVLLFLAKETAAQQGQTLHIVKGKKVTLRADATHAISYIWFRNNEPLNGHHDQRLVVTEPGIYTVIALGDGCDSDVSDPVEITLDPQGRDITVDVEIRNLPEVRTAELGRPFNYQLMILNNGDNEATELLVTFDIPRELEYIAPVGSYIGELTYIAARRQVLWKVPKLAAKESLSIWLSVSGQADGQAITMAKVETKETDRNLSNNQAKSEVKILFLFIPNVITPNGDGKNDAFVIKGLEIFNKRRLRIYTRYGNEVYHAEQYNNNWTADGLNDGTYFYILEIEGANYKSRVMKGYVTVIR